MFSNVFLRFATCLTKTAQAWPTFFVPPTNLWVNFYLFICQPFMSCFSVSRIDLQSHSLAVDWINVAFILASCREASTQHDVASTSMGHSQHDLFEFVAWTVFTACEISHLALSPISSLDKTTLFIVTLESPTGPCAITSVEMFCVICFLKYLML